MKVALAQICPLNADPGAPALEKPHSSSPFPTLDYNLRLTVDHVKRAAAQGAEIAIFPEYFLQGIVNEDRQYLTFPSQHLLAFLQTLAKQHDIALCGTIVHGSIAEATGRHAFPEKSPFTHLLEEKREARGITPEQLEWAKYLEQYPETSDERAEPVLRNTAFFIEAGTGKQLGKYTKRNLWHPERDYLTPGEEDHQEFETKWGKAGMMICWDLSHPAAAQVMVEQGVDVVFCPIYWLGTDSEPSLSLHSHEEHYELSVISALSLARSFETETVWVMCNAGGDELEGFIGGSGIWAPLRGKIGGPAKSEDSLTVIDVDLAVLKDARALYKVREENNIRDAR